MARERHLLLLGRLAHEELLKGLGVVRLALVDLDTQGLKGVEQRHDEVHRLDALQARGELPAAARLQGQGVHDTVR